MVIEFSFWLFSEAERNLFSSALQPFFHAMRPHLIFPTNENGKKKSKTWLLYASVAWGLPFTKVASCQVHRFSLVAYSTFFSFRKLIFGVPWIPVQKYQIWFSLLIIICTRVLFLGNPSKGLFLRKRSAWNSVQQKLIYSKLPAADKFVFRLETSVTKWKHWNVFLVKEIPKQFQS